MTDVALPQMPSLLLPKVNKHFPNIEKDEPGKMSLYMLDPQMSDHFPAEQASHVCGWLFLLLELLCTIS
jgi:hypothetical protein